MAFPMTAVPAAGTMAAVQRCSTPRLVVWLAPMANGTAGGVYYELRFTNLSGHACTLRGFPGVSAVTLVGARIGAAAGHDASKVRTVRLGQAKTASVALRIVDAGNFPVSRCAPVIAAGLRVYPPGASVSRVVPFSFRTCRRTAVEVLGVEAVTGDGASSGASP
jgi:Domain of unknown function (DUF4232)